MRRLPELAILLPAMALVAIALALWGWADHARALDLSWSDVVYRSLAAVGISSLYDTSAGWRGDWRIEVARMLGALAFFVTVTRALTVLLEQQVREIAARWRRGHLVVVGDHPVARSMVEAGVCRRVRITWIMGDEARAATTMPRVLAVRRRWDEGSAQAFGLEYASQAFVALGDEVEQIATVRALRAAVPRLPITMHITDPWFADRLDEIENISGVRYVSLAGTAVRQLHDRSPPFLVARRLEQARLHALIIGCGRTGEATLHDLLISQITSFLGQPRVTIVDPRAAEIGASLTQRCPELHLSADIRFITPEHARDVRALPTAELARAQDDCPFTLAYVSVDTDLRTMELGVSLRALARRERWAIGPIYTRLSAYGAFPGLTANGGGDAAGLVSWGDTRDFAEELGLFDGDADALARAFHEAYAQVAPDRAGTAVRWEALGEEARQSNRHLLVHVPAKLASIGVDVAAWRRAAQDGPGGRAPTPMPDLARHPDLLERLAALEHTRWAMERRLCGWQHGAARDNLRRLHPGLVEWEALPEADRAFNRAMVAAIVEASARAA